MTAKELVIGYEEPLSRPLTFAIERGEKDRAHRCQRNRKTTLLKSILGLIPSLGGNVELGDYLEIGYFEQEMPKRQHQQLYPGNLGRISILYPV